MQQNVNSATQLYHTANSNQETLYDHSKSAFQLKAFVYIRQVSSIATRAARCTAIGYLRYDD